MFTLQSLRISPTNLSLRPPSLEGSQRNNHKTDLLKVITSVKLQSSRLFFHGFCEWLQLIWQSTVLGKYQQSHNTFFNSLFMSICWIRSALGYFPIQHQTSRISFPTDAPFALAAAEELLLIFFNQASSYFTRTNVIKGRSFKWMFRSFITAAMLQLVWASAVPPQVRQRNELGIYLMNLSVADLLYIATLPLWIDYFLQHDDWIHGQESCKLFGFIFYTNIYVSIAFLCCISMDRYLAVAYPLRFAKVRRIKTGRFWKQSLEICNPLTSLAPVLMFFDLP